METWVTTLTESSNFFFFLASLLALQQTKIRGKTFTLAPTTKSWLHLLILACFEKGVGALPEKRAFNHSLHIDSLVVLQIAGYSNSGYCYIIIIISLPPVNHHPVIQHNRMTLCTIASNNKYLSGEEGEKE